jgi:hypothetical protein
MQVSETLSDEARESQSVGQLKRQLISLQTEVDAASQRLALTKARVAHNMQRVDHLKAEAVRAHWFVMKTGIPVSPCAGLHSLLLERMQGRLERMKAAADEAQQALPSASSLVASPAADALAATAAAAVQPQRVQQRTGGSSRLLTSSLELEPGLRNHWFPAHFSSVSALLSVLSLRADAELAIHACTPRKGCYWPRKLWRPHVKYLWWD